MPDVAELERRAREALEPGVHAFYASGAGDETTAADNLAAWGRLRLRPRVLRDVSAVQTAASLLGERAPAPILVAPFAYQRLLHAGGEAETARGAARAGMPLVLSTRTSVPIGEVAAACGEAPWWFQVYVLRDRDWTRELVERAAGAGCRALVLTADAPVLGAKPRADGAGFAVPDELFMPDAPSRHPGVALAGYAGAEQDPALTFDDIEWLAGIAGLPVVVKGVLRADDARACVGAGAAAVVVSNHGGRQLDGAIATADALPDVVAAVGSSAEVYVDGGVRSGLDVLRALALGARAVLVGRPVAWALAAGGAGEVTRLLVALRAELALAMALAGAPEIADVTRDLVAHTADNG
jgi:4-hydroxymandelate oxidase